VFLLALAGFRGITERLKGYFRSVPRTGPVGFILSTTVWVRHEKYPSLPYNPVELQAGNSPHKRGFRNKKTVFLLLIKE